MQDLQELQQSLNELEMPEPSLMNTDSSEQMIAEAKIPNLNDPRQLQTLPPGARKLPPPPPHRQRLSFKADESANNQASSAPQPAMVEARARAVQRKVSFREREMHESSNLLVRQTKHCLQKLGELTRKWVAF